MYMSELIIDFVEYLEVERGRSSKTSENYRRYLERFVEFAGDDKVEKITVDSGDFKDGDVDEYLPESIAPLTLRDVQRLYETDTTVR